MPQRRIYEGESIENEIVDLKGCVVDGCTFRNCTLTADQPAMMLRNSTFENCTFNGLADLADANFASSIVEVTVR